jgi:hypothetical protein
VSAQEVDRDMTNKQQAVSDAMLAAGLAAFKEAGPGRRHLWDHELREIYLAMQAASHPLEQQQAVSGDVVAAVFSESITDQARRLGISSKGFLRYGPWADAVRKQAICLALTASGMGRMRPLIEQVMHELEDSDYPYHRSLGAEIRTALQEDLLDASRDHE